MAPQVAVPGPDKVDDVTSSFQTRRPLSTFSMRTMGPLKVGSPAPQLAAPPPSPALDRSPDALIRMS